MERFDREQICEFTRGQSYARLTRPGEPHCPSDLRYNSPKAQAPSLPLCALRPVQPAIKPSGKNDGGYVYDHPLASHDRYTIQRNKTANRKWQYNVVTWSWGDNVDPESNKAKELVRDLGRGMATATGEFVRGLKIGDVVSVWGKARFPGWVNNVEKVRIDVYWAI